MILTGLQWALISGLFLGAGLVALVWQFAPSEPDLADVLHRYSPAGVSANAKANAVTAVIVTGTKDKLGIWAMRRVPPHWWGNTPTTDLALLRRPLHQHYGKKVLYAIYGLIIPPLLTTAIQFAGWSLPIFIPAGLSLALAALFFFVPDIDARAEAKAARAEFTAPLTLYLQLVALEREGGAGARQAMEAAAELPDFWVFPRIADVLSVSLFSGQAPWDALHDMSVDLGIPELDDLADIMRLSTEGSQVAANLRARAASLQSATLAHELEKANVTTQKMTIPQALTGVVFMAILIAPQLLRVV